jgi:HEPN domain-containing protein
MKNKLKHSSEWIKQAEYDLKTAEELFKTGRYIYTIFMCHLSIEKALKGIYSEKFKKDPPRTHNLNYFCKTAEISLGKDFEEFIDNLNDLSVPTRYPDDLERLLKDYKKSATFKILAEAKDLLKCLKKKI